MKKWQSSWLVLSGVLLAGCSVRMGSGIPVQIGIVDVATNTMERVSVRGSENTLVSCGGYDKKRKSFRVLAFGRDGLKLDTFGLGGQRIGSHEFPKLKSPQSTGLFFLENGREYTISPDSRRLLYYNHDGLSVFDLETETNTVIDGITLHSKPRGMLWVDNDEALVVTCVGQSTLELSNRIVSIGMNPSVIRSLYVSEGSIGRGPDPSLSPDSTRLVFIDRCIGQLEQDVLKVIDVKSGEVDNLVERARTDGIKFPCWSPDGDFIAFVCNREIWVVNVKLRTSRSLGKFTIHDDILAVAFASRGVIMYEASPDDRDDYSLYAVDIDIADAPRRRVVRTTQGGFLLGIPDEGKILVELP